MLANSVRRAAVQAVRTAAPRRAASTVSDVALVGIESRWARLPECEQAAIAEKLLDKQKGDWRQMTAQEKKAGASALPSRSSPQLTVAVRSLLHCLRQPLFACA